MTAQLWSQGLLCVVLKNFYHLVILLKHLNILIYKLTEQQTNQLSNSMEWSS